MMGIEINNDTNTRIIVDDIVNHGQDLATSLLYMECQLQVCQAYRLSLSLKKSFIFPKRFEFVGNDVCPDGNRPAQSKHQLLQSWPPPEIVRNVALALPSSIANTSTTSNSGSYLFVN